MARGIHTSSGKIDSSRYRSRLAGSSDARLNSIIFAAKEPKTGSIFSIDNFFEKKVLNHKVNYKFGLFEEDSSKLLKDFFEQRR